MKKFFMIVSIFIVLLFLPFESSFPGQDPPEILKIREQYKLWQKVLNKEAISKGEKFYLTSFGRNYREANWFTVLDESGDYFVWQEITLIKDDKLGLMFYSHESSPSHDWNCFSEHYYFPSGELFFVFLRLNTLHADEPLTIERRLYLNKEGKRIRFLESVYKLGTQEKISEPNYLPYDETYWQNIKKLPFYNLLKKTQLE